MTCVRGHAPGETCRLGAGLHGAVAPTLGGDGGAGAGAWWHRGGRAGYRYLSVDDSARPAGTRGEDRAAGGTDSATGWGPETHLGYSLQGNVKTREGRQHPGRDAQFRYLADTVTRAQRRGQPAISVDTKKKELVGDFKNGGRVWRRHGEPDRVRVHDFRIRDPGHGKAIPYGVYDLRRDEGWVSVGIDHDTASFAVNAIRRWWRQMGREAYPRARSLVITADAGGSNGPRVRLWKWELQRLVNRTGLTITVCHFPPGTSKWNKSNIASSRTSP